MRLTQHSYKIVVVMSLLFISLFTYIVFFQKDSLLIQIEELIYDLKGIEVIGVSGDEDIGIRAVIRPFNSSPLGLEGVNVKAFHSIGEINVQFVGNQYVHLFNSQDNTPSSSSVDISKLLNEGGILEKPIVSMQEIVDRVQELEEAFLKLPRCPEYNEITENDEIKYKICIFERNTNGCSSTLVTAFSEYICMLEGVNEWPKIGDVPRKI